MAYGWPKQFYEKGDAYNAKQRYNLKEGKDICIIKGHSYLLYKSLLRVRTPQLSPFKICQILSPELVPGLSE